ncbi:hypothetical protein QBC41DRAFT_136143 [Cercophora samala]|uniref:Uncharacterized protein n=1 Tax=Cercophora samala TaxID=330535 RepID=A0AA40DGB9_9PEZI|nr:hypothetical protein QBC41DRAFT_136143 [Cercophora samala]
MPFSVQVTAHARLPPARTKCILAGLAILPVATISWMIDPTTTDTHTHTQPNEEICRNGQSWRPVILESSCQLHPSTPPSLVRKEKGPSATSTHVALLISYRRLSRPRAQ